MTERPDRTEADWARLHANTDDLIKLRVSIARLAQRAGLGHLIPHPSGTGTLEDEGPEADFTLLSLAAGAADRGWNRLVAHLMDKFPDREP